MLFTSNRFDSCLLTRESENLPCLIQAVVILWQVDFGRTVFSKIFLSVTLKKHRVLQDIKCFVSEEEFKPSIAQIIYFRM